VIEANRLKYIFKMKTSAIKQKCSTKRKSLTKDSQVNANGKSQYINPDKASAVTSGINYIKASNKSLAIHKVSLDFISFTVPIPSHFQQSLFASIERYRLKAKNCDADFYSDFQNVNEQFKANCYRKNGQYKHYLVIPIKSKTKITYVLLGYQPKGDQNALWLRFNPSHFSTLGYQRLKSKLVEILGNLNLVLQYFPLAVPTRLDIAVDFLGITPNHLLADLHETRKSSLHFSAGDVETITMGTNRSPTQACIYKKGFTDSKCKSNVLTGTRVEIRLRRLNSNKAITLDNLARSLPSNPFKRLHLYLPDEQVISSINVKLPLVLAAARSIGLKAVIGMVPENDRKTLRRALKAMQVTYVDSDADRIWQQVPGLLAPLAMLYKD